MEHTTFYLNRKERQLKWILHTKTGGERYSELLGNQSDRCAFCGILYKEHFEFFFRDQEDLIEFFEEGLPERLIEIISNDSCVWGEKQGLLICADCLYAWGDDRLCSSPGEYIIVDTCHKCHPQLWEVIGTSTGSYQCSCCANIFRDVLKKQ